MMLTAQNAKQNTHFKFTTSNNTNAKVKKKKRSKCMEMASIQNLIYEAELKWILANTPLTKWKHK